MSYELSAQSFSAKKCFLLLYIKRPFDNFVKESCIQLPLESFRRLPFHHGMVLSGEISNVILKTQKEFYCNTAYGFLTKTIVLRKWETSR